MHPCWSSRGCAPCSAMFTMSGVDKTGVHRTQRHAEKAGLPRQIALTCQARNEKAITNITTNKVSESLNRLFSALGALAFGEFISAGQLPCLWLTILYIGLEMPS